MRPADHAKVFENNSADRFSEDLAATLAAIYPELRRIARGMLSRERKHHTLQPTALANEVVTRLLKREMEGEDRKLIVTVCIREMQTILIDSGRRRQYRTANPPPEFNSGQVRIDDVVHLQVCLQELGKLDPRARQVVELRFFVGLTIPEVSEFLGVSERTINEDWEYARRWLARHWRDDDGTTAA